MTSERAREGRQRLHRFATALIDLQREFGVAIVQRFMVPGRAEGAWPRLGFELREEGKRLDHKEQRDWRRLAEEEAQAAADAAEETKLTEERG